MLIIEEVSSVILLLCVGALRSTWTCKNIEKIQQKKHFLTSPSNYVIQWMMQLLIELCWSWDSMLPCLRWLISLHTKQHNTTNRRNASRPQTMFMKGTFPAEGSSQWKQLEIYLSVNFGNSLLLLSLSECKYIDAWAQPPPTGYS